MKAKRMKVNVEMMAAFEKAGVDVHVDVDWIRISYYCEHGQEQDEDIPRDVDSIAAWLYDAWNTYDVSEKTIIWLDESGHGKDGAPYDMADVLADNKEWEDKLYELYEIARKHERN